MPKVTRPIRVLILSRNIDTVEVICAAAQKAMIQCEIVSDSETAVTRLSKEKFEGILFDFDVLESCALCLELLRSSKSHQQAITFALVAETEQAKEATRLGIHFILRRPLDEAELRRTLRAAFPLLMRERRRYFRCPIVIPVLMDCAEGGRVVAKSINISEGGMALEGDVSISVGKKLVARFQLPGSEERVYLNASVCWKKQRVMGIQFLNIPTYVLVRLQSWLSDRVEQTIPSHD